MTVLDPSSLTPAEVRQLCREDKWQREGTAGVCDGHVQANVIILPEKYARDFRLLCQRNPVSCPLLGETLPGDPTVPAHLALNADIRTDCPAYALYRDGKRLRTASSIADVWADDSVAFFIGCSFSFESKLVQEGLEPRHSELGRNVPMYKTKVPLCAAGVFSGNMVVSMRPYSPSHHPLVRSITSPFIHAHGEPVAYGPSGALSLGIDDPLGLNPDFGDASELKEGEVPVYWGCGVTPQNVVMSSGLKEVVVGHLPGSMLVLDMRNEELQKGW